MKCRSIKKRITWGFNPVTRTIPSKKRYVRSRDKSLVYKASKIQKKEIL